MAAASAASAAAEEPGLVGTWRLVAFEDHYKDGKVDKPFGEHPRGYFIYDPTGHLSIHIMKVPALEPFVLGDSDKATDAEKIKAFDAYVGYFGTYRVDKKNRFSTIRSKARSTPSTPTPISFAPTA